jgi:polyhydroxybutyrate depolymerase
MAKWRALLLLCFSTLRYVLSGSSHWVNITSGSDTRQVKLFLPPTTSAISLPLIVNFHPMGMSPDEWDVQANFNTLADTEGFIVAYPRGLEPAETISGIVPGIPDSWFTAGFTWNAGSCCPAASRNRTDDVQFTRDLLAQLKGGVVKKASGGLIDIDPTRVYAAGGSNGAFLSYRLACEAPELFAAFAPVAGVLANDTRGKEQDPAWPSDSFGCVKRSRPVPILITHGTWDPLVLWGGQPLLNFRSVEDNVKLMKTLNSVPDSDPGVVTYKYGHATCTSFGQNVNNVTFCQVNEMGHSWPTHSTICELTKLVPGSFCSTDVDATVQAWEFFKRYRLSDAEAEGTLLV